MSLIEVSTFGSCASRMLFNSKFSPNYKNFFHINFSVEGSSLISLMSKPIIFDNNLLTAENPFDNLCVENDLSKNYLSFLKENDMDYIIIDTYFDLFDILVINDDSYITDSARLRRTELFKTLNITRKINIRNNNEEFFKLWKKSCDLFLKFIDNYCPNTKIILNASRLVCRYENSNGTIETESSFIEKANMHNSFRNQLESYLLKNYDVEVLPFDELTLLDKNHIFGFEPSHYSMEYYSTKVNQLNQIIYRNNYFNSYDHEINYNFRKLKRENVILKFNVDK